MEHDHNRLADQQYNMVAFRAEDLYYVETYFWEKGCSEFEYDAVLDVFRFTEDGRFAFCREFADWRCLESAGIWTSEPVEVRNLLAALRKRRAVESVLY